MPYNFSKIMNEEHKITFKPSDWFDWVHSNSSGNIADASAYQNLVQTVITSNGNYTFDNIDNTVDINDAITDAYHEFLAAKDKLESLLKIAQKYS